MPAFEPFDSREVTDLNASSDEVAPPRNAATNASMWSWALYDWANSAFPTVIQTFVFAAYFTRRIAVNETTGSAQWGYSLSFAGLMVALGGPLLGAIADQGGRRKPWIAAFTFLCVVATAFLWFITPSSALVWPALVIVVIGTVGSEFATVFYNAMLPDLVPSDRMGRWSGWAWGLGYAGGLCCLLISLVVFVQGHIPWVQFDHARAQHVRASFLLVSVWYLVFSVPLFWLTPDRVSTTRSFGEAVRRGLTQLRTSLENVSEYGNILRFLVARMFFIDGLTTLFSFGGVYAAGTFDMNEQQVLVFGIALNVSAGVGAAGFAWVDDWVGARKTILVSLIGLTLPAVAILSIHGRWVFWGLGLILGVFVGPVQASSRSYMGRVAPEGLRTEMFGLFALAGKATTFLGPLLVGWITYWSRSQRLGMAVIPTFFLVGFLLMLSVEPEQRGREAAAHG